VALTHFDKTKKRLAEAVRRRRLELTLTQEAAAASVKMAPRHYQKLEAGQLNVTLRTLTTLVTVLDLDVLEVFGRG
jgi:transcriptional regulator with XRE-family HTH domain